MKNIIIASLFAFSAAAVFANEATQTKAEVETAAISQTAEADIAAVAKTAEGAEAKEAK